MTSEIRGVVHTDFRPVARRLAKMLPRSRPGGAGLAVWHRGEWVLDCWGGTRDRAGNAWERDTLVNSFSTTKGVIATLLHTLVEEGLLDYDDPVSRHWPEFAAAGKETVTIRHLLSHEAGLHRIRDMIDDARRMLDWSAMVGVLEGQRPAFRPGTANAYHGLTYGWLVGEVVRRVGGAEIPEALRARIAEPLGLEGLYCGLPEEAFPRRAELLARRRRRPSAATRTWFRLWALWLLILTLGRINLFETVAALMPRGFWELDYNDPAVARASIPAANGTFSARSLAHLYAVLANEGELEGVRLLSAGTLRRATAVQNRRRDRVLQLTPQWRLGYHRVVSFLGPRSGGFGHFGFGGSGAWADPERRLACGFTVNFDIGKPFADARIITLTREILRCADSR